MTNLNSLVLSIKRHLSFKSTRSKDPHFHNVLVNAFAVMLIYSGHFGSCAIAPIVIESMKGISGIDTHLLFSGMAVSSFVTVISCPLISPAIDKFGTRFCLILGGICITTLPPSLFYPVPPIFLTFQAVNGLGCALLRAASLKYLTDNSPYNKLAEYNGLHWSIFMACVLAGNCVLFVATGSNDTITNDLRFRICISLTAIGTVGILLYLTALRRTGRELSEISSLLSDSPNQHSPNSSTTSSHPAEKQQLLLAETQIPKMEQKYQSAILQPLDSSPGKEDYERCYNEGSRDFAADREYLDSVSSRGENVEEKPRFWDSTLHLLRWSTVNLVVAMLSCAVFPLMFNTLGPMFIGLFLQDKRYVAIFGICAGLGEIGGSLLTGKIISKFGLKISAVLIAIVAFASVSMCALAFPLKGHENNPIVPPAPAFLLFLGICLGLGDSSNGVIISTLIGKVYKEFSQAGFAVYSLVFNASCISLYFVSSYCYFEVVVWVSLGIVCCTLPAILLLKRSEIECDKDK